MFLWYHLSYHVLNFTHERDWTNSVLPNPCGGDAITCLCGLFCIPCLTCSNARHLGQSGLVYCLLSCFCNPIAAFLLRQKAREKFWIDGSDCEDFVSWCYNKCTFIVGKLTTSDLCMLLWLLRQLPDRRGNPSYRQQKSRVGFRDDEGVNQEVLWRSRIRCPWSRSLHEIYLWLNSL